MKDHIDVVTVMCANVELKRKINDMLKPNDTVISVVMTEQRSTLKTFLVVINRNVSDMNIKRRFSREVRTGE